MSRDRPGTLLDGHSAEPFRFGVAVSRFNAELSGSLLDAAVATLRAHGAEDDRIRIARVPGAYELPMAADRLAASGCDAVVCVGALIRGETPHFDVLAHATAVSLHRVALARGVPVTFGVLTCDTMGQALARAGGEHGNKGAEAAAAAIEMAVRYAELTGS